MSASPPVPAVKPKKKGFFSRLFKKKERTIAKGLEPTRIGVGIIIPSNYTGADGVSPKRASTLPPSQSDLSTLSPVNAADSAASTIKEKPTKTANGSSIPSKTSTVNKTASTPQGKPVAAPAPAEESWLSIFPDKVILPMHKTPLPSIGERIDNTAQLAYTNILIRKHQTPLTQEEIGDADKKPLPLEPEEQSKLEAILNEEEELRQIDWLATRVVEEFAGDALKIRETVTEVVLLGPSLNREYHRKLTNVLISAFEKAQLLDEGLLEGLIEMVECAGPGYLVADDLVKILVILRTRLENTHMQSSRHPYYIVLAISRLLDVMVEGKVEGLNRVVDHEPLQELLNGLAGNDDYYLKHQAAYAYQALLHIPNDESKAAMVLRHGVASVMTLDFSGFSEGLSKSYEAAIGIIDIADKVVSGIQSAREGGQGLWEGIKRGALAGGRVIWYMALREAQEHIRNGRLSEFNKFVFSVQCNCNIEFQWGICLFLGEIAIDPLWDSVTRKHAIEFLGGMYKNPLLTPKKPDPTVYSWILNILRQVSEVTDKEVAKRADLMLTALKDEGDVARKALYTECIEGPSNPFPIKIRLTPPSNFPLLKKVQDIPDIEYPLNVLKNQRLAEPNRDIFIPPQAKPTITSPDSELFPLLEKVLDFLKSDHKVFLIQGDSGAGKSTFNRHLERKLWEDYKKYGAIPLHINLPSIDRPEHELIEKHLNRCGFQREQIQEMKLHRRVVLICDGYDESQLRLNLHSHNKWNQAGQWKVKMIVTCRNQFLTAEYRGRFQPTSGSRYDRGSDQAEHLEEAVISAFNIKQIEQYVEAYANQQVEEKREERPWTKNEYMEKLRTIPNLMELVTNPFLLSLSLDALPLAIKTKKEVTSLGISRVELYDTFILQWLSANQTRIMNSPLSQSERRIFSEICDSVFSEIAIEFQRNLAEAIYREQNGNPIVQFTALRDKSTWKFEFFNPEGQAKLLRDASTINKSNTQFKFIHKSLLEYFYSRNVYDPLFYNQSESGEENERLPTTDDVKNVLNKRSLIAEPSVLQFLAERVLQDGYFKQQLEDIIEISKTDEKAGLAAANAITILIRAGLQFNGVDFSGIRIPGADLRGGEFDSASLEGADLTNVTLSKAWLRRANLSKAIMTGVEFGELPFLKSTETVQQLAWSNDGKLLVELSGHPVGKFVSVYNATNWERVAQYPGYHAIAASPTSQEVAIGQEDKSVKLCNILTGEARLTLVGHTAAITCIAYSPDGKLVAAGSAVEEIHIWSTVSGKSECVIKAPTFPVKCIAFSPSNLQLVACGTSGAPQIWSVKSGEKFAKLEGHVGSVESLAYSKDGHQIATGGVDRSIRIWDAQSGGSLRVLSGHYDAVNGVAFSRDGLRLASCSSDHTIRVWDPKTGSARNTLFGHLLDIRCIAFSPKGDLIASGGMDKTTRLWGAGSGLNDAYPDNTAAKLVSVDVSPDGKKVVTGNTKGDVQIWEMETGKAGAKLGGHKDAITEVAFSPCGTRFATASMDTTVRLWDAKTGKPESVVIPHSRSVTCVSFSPDGALLVTSGHDSKVRIWDSKTGKSERKLEGHKGRVWKTSFSPSGHQLASCSDDGTVLVWDPKTGEKLFDLEYKGEIHQVLHAPDGESIVAVIPGEKLVCWDSQSGERVKMDDVEGNVARCSFTPDGNLFAVTSRDAVLRLWDCPRELGGKWTKVLETMIGVSSWMKWTQTSDRHNLVTLDKTGNLCIWELKKESSDSYALQLDWCSGFEVLSLVEANLDGIVGLSPANLQLITQRISIH
ncbi:hypothetical protein FBU30_006441 [Linnemannia zychae]|nr:hypothetical protein FBU30_006441 [Linnemannia zychae]